MRAPEPLRGLRVAAPPGTLDGLVVADDLISLRLAPDELLAIGVGSIAVDSDGIAEDERGFVGWWLTPHELAEVARHVEWTIPAARPVLAQGLIAGVPAKLWLTDDRALLLCTAAYAHELVERLP